MLARVRRLAAPALLVLMSCAHPNSPAPAHGGATELSRLVDAYFDAKYAFEPTSGTGVGFHAHDAALEDLSRARIEARAAEVRTFIRRFDELPATSLTFDEAIDREFLASQARAELFEFDTWQTWRHNPMGYARLPGEAIDSLMKRAFAPAPERLRSVVARLRAIPTIYDAARANVVDPAPEHVALALRMAKGSIGFFETATPTWAAGVAKEPGADAALMKDFAAANATALAATRAFAIWLEHDLAPKAHASFAMGADRYRELLRLEEMVETPLPELEAMAEAQLARDHAAFVATGARIQPGAKPEEVMRKISAEHPTAADLIPSVARGLEAARAFATTRGLVTFPSESRPLVRETPPYARDAVFASMDTPGVYDPPGLDAYYYVTPVEPEWTREHADEHLRMFNPYTTASIDVHEAYPGHFLQFLYMPRITSKARKLLYTTANVEGWAHYAEQMMIDEGFAETFGADADRVRLAQLQEALLRDCRFVVALGLHTHGMTVDAATRVFVERGFQETANGHEEALRGTYDPMYLAYTLGKLQIQGLRDRYRARTGRDLRAFHDAFVAQGGLPVSLIEKILMQSPR